MAQQAFNTSMSGMNAAQTAITVVADNIANLNTWGFKESTVSFQDIWYNTTTGGSAPTANRGGTNGIQVGIGTTVSSITRNFEPSTINTTGRQSDLYIQGHGFFTVQAPDGSVYYTRAGNFSLDPNGHLVAPNGYRLMGTNSDLSITNSGAPVKIPQLLQADPVPQQRSVLMNKTGRELNDCDLSSGVFNISPFYDGIRLPTITANIPDASQPMHVIIADINQSIQDSIDAESGKLTVQMGQISSDITTKNNRITDINTELGTLPPGDPRIPELEAERTALLNDITKLTKDWADLDAQRSHLATLKLNLRCELTDGATVTFNTGDPSGKTTLNFTTGSPVPPNYSNFVQETQISLANPKGGVYESKILDWKVDIQPADVLSESIALVRYTFSDNGVIEATYSNGARITVFTDPDSQAKLFKYTTSTGVEILGPRDAQANTLALIPENLQVQFANVTNPNGLLGVGNNMFAVGPNAGRIIYSSGANNGVGAVTSGGLETSNVDLARQFSNMIMAQRAVEANSRVFDTANSILQTLVYLGR
jgi:flagellar hook protein FlgE